MTFKLDHIISYERNKKVFCTKRTRLLSFVVHVLVLSEGHDLVAVRGLASINNDQTVGVNSSLAHSIK